MQLAQLFTSFGETLIMRRFVVSFSLAAVFGMLLTTGTALACHRKACKPACAPEPVCAPQCAPAPVCEPEPVCEPACAPRKKCGLFAGGHGLFKKKNRCAPDPCAATVMVTTAIHYTHAAPQAAYAAPQMQHAAPQAPVKGMPQIPSKQGQ